MRDARRRPRRDGPTLGEALAVLCGGYALAILMHWPLALHLPTDVAKDLGDPLAQAWQLAWDGHALRSLKFDPWQANIFWPNRDSLAFSDSLLGYAPFALLGSGPRAAVAQYNLVYFFTYALSVTGPFVLARTLGLRAVPALLAGLAFAWSPWRWEQSGHLQVMSSGTLALSVALLVAGYRRGDAKLIYWGWIVAAWQLLIGVTLGVQLLYLLMALGLVGLVLWIRAGRPRFPSKVAVASIWGLAILACVAVFVIPPYLRVQRDHPEAKRSLGEVAFFSPPLKSYIAASERNTVWGGVTAPIRATLRAPAEQTLFPGATIVVLAVAGCTLASPFSRRVRIGLVAMTLLCALFSLGLSLDHGRFTYRLLYDYAPGWKGSRTPGRLNTLTTLSLAMLAGAGAQVMLGSVRFKVPARRRLGSALLALALAVGILAEGSAFRSGGALGFAPHPTVPTRPRALDDAPDPLLELPAPGAEEKSYVLWSTDGFPRLVNGASSIEPRRTIEIIEQATNFPDARSVKFLRNLGVRTVVLHRDLTIGTPWEHAADRAVAGLGITRTVFGNSVVFHLLVSGHGGTATS